MEIDPITEILPGLYLGGNPDDYDIKLAKIQHIIQVNSEYPLYSISALQSHVQIPFEDDLTKPWPLGKIDLVLDRLKAIRMRQGNLLIHCMFGRDRSANLLLLYLCCNGMSKDKAIKLLETKRPIVAVPNLRLLPTSTFDEIVERHSSWNINQKD